MSIYLFKFKWYSRNNLPLVYVVHSFFYFENSIVIRDIVTSKRGVGGVPLPQPRAVCYANVRAKAILGPAVYVNLS